MTVDSPKTVLEALEPNRPSHAEYQRRVGIVRLLILNGEAKEGVLAEIKARFKISPRHSYNYFKAAEKQIARAAGRNRIGWLAEHIAARRILRIEASRLDPAKISPERRIRLQLDILREEAELLGLYDQREVVPAGALTCRTVHQMTDAELLAIAGEAA